MTEYQASGLVRLLACNGSRGMGNSLPIPPQTDDAVEGIAAHFVANAVLTGLISDPLEYVDRQTPSGFYVTPDMAEFVAVYLDALASRQSPVSGCEVQTDFGFENGDIIRARADHIAYEPIDEILDIDDFKYGYHAVEPDDNWTLIAYAIGYCIRYDVQPKLIRLNIHQPRPFHRDGPCRTATLDWEQLKAKKNELEHLLSNLDDVLVTGERQCYMCPAAPTCPAHRNAAMNGIEASSIAFAEDIPDDILAYELDLLDRAKSAIEARLTAATELATHRAQSGRTIPGRILENSLGNRRWLKTTTPAMLNLIGGKEMTKVKLPTLAEAKAAGMSDETINGLTERPPLGFKLIKRNTSKQAAKMFGDKAH